MKHSTALLATWVTLRVLIVLNWILGALIFALLAISFQAEEWTWQALGVVAIASAVSTKEVPLRINGNFDLTGWLAILLLFVLAQVFLEGTRMREDLEGIV